MPLIQFIAAPGDPSKEMTYQKLVNKIAPLLGSPAGRSQSIVHAIDIPDFKIGTLDSLVLVSDDLQKYDSVVESSVNKMADTLYVLLEDESSSLGPAGGNGGSGGTRDRAWMSKYLTVNDQAPVAYVENFEWNAIKYRADKNVKDIADGITQEVSSIDAIVRNKMASYNALKGNLNSFERKQGGSLSVKSLHDIVRREHFVLDSEYLQTVLLAVPKNSEKEFLGTYERWTSMVVPRSASLIASDDDFSLYGVVVFIKTLSEFLEKARENKCIYREYVYNEDAIEKERRDQAELGSNARDQKASLLRLCRTQFSEVFSAWVHIKILRVFVESVLRYGLPPDFQTMVIVVPAKLESKVRDTLNKHYSHLSPAMNPSADKDNMDEVTTMMVDAMGEFFPYANFDMRWNH